MRLLGSIDALPSGHYRYRVTVRGKRTKAVVPTHGEALRLQLEVSRRAQQPDAITLAKYGEHFLEWRELVQKSRDTANDKSRWKVHVSASPLASTPIREIRARDVERWAESLTGLVRTRRNALNLLRRCFDRARREHVIPVNPALGVHVEGSDPEVWTYLAPAEQRLLMTADAIPEPERVVIAFAVGTGLRQGEQWALELRDLDLGDDPHVIVRWGSRGRPTKTGRVRRVPLVPWLVPIMRAWVATLPAYLVSPSGKKVYANERGLVFPTARGNSRRTKKPPRAWSKWLTALRIRGVTGHPVVWHSLRHTCASMLVSGAWGRRWTLQEVGELLGHSSTETTERYAHLSEGTIARAARETMSRPCHGGPETLRATRDLNAGPSVPETYLEAVALRGVTPDMTPAMTSLAEDVIRMVAGGDGRAIARAVQLAEMVLGSAANIGVPKKSTGA